MPSTVRQLQYIGLRVLAWVLWLPFTGNVRHSRTWGELKRLNPQKAALMLVPLVCYAAVATWLYLFFPQELYVWAGSAWGVGIALGGFLILFTTGLTRIIDWRLARA